MRPPNRAEPGFARWPCISPQLRICSSVVKLVQPAAQGNTPGAGFLAEFVLRWFHAWLCFWLCLHARLCRAHAEAHIRISRCEAAIQLYFFKQLSFCFFAQQLSIPRTHSGIRVASFCSHRPPNEGWMERRQAHFFFRSRLRSATTRSRGDRDPSRRSTVAVFGCGPTKPATGSGTGAAATARAKH